MESFAKAFTPNQSIEKEEVMDYLYWIKQFISIIFGCIAGSMELSGFPIIVLFGVGLSGCSLLYSWQVLKAEDVEAWDIVSEAFGPSFFCFMLFWTLTYTFI
jgi:EMC6